MKLMHTSLCAAAATAVRGAVLCHLAGKALEHGRSPFEGWVRAGYNMLQQPTLVPVCSAWTVSLCVSFLATAADQHWGVSNQQAPHKLGLLHWRQEGLTRLAALRQKHGCPCEPNCH